MLVPRVASVVNVSWPCFWLKFIMSLPAWFTKKSSNQCLITVLTMAEDSSNW